MLTCYHPECCPVQAQPHPLLSGVGLEQSLALLAWDVQVWMMDELM